jgi:hypothetical protein
MKTETKDEMTVAREIGTMTGRQIAQAVLHEGLLWTWTGFGAEGSRRLLAAGIKPGSPAWVLAQRSAVSAYDRMIGGE